MSDNDPVTALAEALHEHEHCPQEWPCHWTSTHKLVSAAILAALPEGWHLVHEDDVAERLVRRQWTGEPSAVAEARRILGVL